MSEPPKRHAGLALSREAERAVVASRSPNFYRDVVTRVLANDDLVARYSALVNRVKASGAEFLEDTYPYYAEDLQVLREIEDHICSIDSTLTQSEITKILQIIRVDLGYEGCS